MWHHRRLKLGVATIAVSLSICCLRPHAAEPAASSAGDTPADFESKTAVFDHVKREAMIPMRDGVQLHTFVLVPKGAHDAPMLLTRTPYNASWRVLRFNSPHLAAAVQQMQDSAVAAGYIIVYQDVRGKHRSEGDYVMTRPLKGFCDAGTPPSRHNAGRGHVRGVEDRSVATPSSVAPDPGRSHFRRPQRRTQFPIPPAHAQQLPSRARPLTEMSV